jgi:adenine C2-methylase RlmN of 23S rRNA A2503 and tRNA A37
MVEYVVLRGVNDSLQQAHDLGQLLRGKDVIVNLIPWNPVYSPDGPAFEAPDLEQVIEFQALCIREYGLHCTVRQEKGGCCK